MGEIREKIIISGDNLEYYSYDIPIKTGFKVIKKAKTLGQHMPLEMQKKLAKKKINDEEKKEITRFSLTRARQNIRRIVNSNPDCNKFLTLTFKNEQFNFTNVNYEFNKFIKKIKRRFKKKEIKYIVVPEFHKSHGLHLHVMCNFPYIKAEELATIWDNGFLKINKIEHVNNAGIYISKYITKELGDIRFKNKKKFTKSKNLEKPKVYKNENVFTVLSHCRIELKKQLQWDTEYRGVIQYGVYKIKAMLVNPRKIKRIYKDSKRIHYNLKALAES